MYPCPYPVEDGKGVPGVGVGEGEDPEQLAEPGLLEFKKPAVGEETEAVQELTRERAGHQQASFHGLLWTPVSPLASLTPPTLVETTELQQEGETCSESMKCNGRKPRLGGGGWGVSSGRNLQRSEEI